MTLLPRYHNSIKNIERFHSYLYSALTVSDNLFLQSFESINPWFELILNVNVDSISTSRKRDFIVDLKERELNAEEEQIRNKFGLQDFDTRLSILSKWLLDQFNVDDAITIDKIEHYNFQEEYHFRNSEETCRVQFYYNNDWQVKPPKPIGVTSLGSLVVKRLENLKKNKDEYPFIGDLQWNIKEYEKLNDILTSENAFITEIRSFNYKDRLKVTETYGDCEFDLTYNGNGFYTAIDFIYKSSNDVVDRVIQAIKTLKND